MSLKNEWRTDCLTTTEMSSILENGMSDPFKHKQLGEVVAEVKLNPKGEVMKLHHLADRSVLKNSPKDQIMNSIKRDLEKVADHPNTTLQRILTSFSYSEGDALKDFDFGNVLIEAFLPYCLHIPNHLELPIFLPEQKLEALVIAEKIWTKRAKSDEEPSDNVDFFAEKSTLYFKKSTVLGPKMPFHEEEGWEPYITGRNIEKINDRNGLFRYTKIFIQFHLELPAHFTKNPDKPLNQVLKQIHDLSLMIINRLIDNYREITGEFHVRRLGKLSINMVYFTKENLGYYLADLNTTTAIINRSQDEVKELKSRMKLGEKPDLYKLLMLSSKSSMESGDYTLSVVESYQALEIFLENYLKNLFVKKGISEKDYTKTLEKHWRTKERLNEVLKDLKGSSLNQNKVLWNTWCHHYDQTRKMVIHYGKDPSEKEVLEMFNINEAVINWVSSL